MGIVLTQSTKLLINVFFHSEEGFVFLFFLFDSRLKTVSNVSIVKETPIFFIKYSTYLILKFIQFIKNKDVIDFSVYDFCFSERRFDIANEAVKYKREQ